MTSATIKLETQLMQARTGVSANAWERWFRHIGITSITELKNRYHGCEHAECMRHAIAECENHIYGAKVAA